MLSIVTPWLDHSELIPAYEAAVQGAHVVIVDTGSGTEHRLPILNMVRRLNGYHQAWLDGRPFSFAAACNDGFARATRDVVLFLNNDIAADPGWLAAVERDVRANPDALVGAASDVRGLAGRPLLYLEVWCIAATRAVWGKLSVPRSAADPGGPWDSELFKRPYWEDVDLCWRATTLGIRLKRRAWPVRHLSNVTSDSTPGAKDASDANRDALDKRIAEYDRTRGVARI